MRMELFKHRAAQSFVLLTILYAIHLSVRGQSADELLRVRARQYEPVMIQAASKYHIDPRLLWTVAYLESRFRPELISPVGARGLMQFMPATATRYNLMNPHDAPQSIEAAAHYLKDLSLRFNNRLDLVLAAYNAGEGAVESYRSGVKLVLATGKIINPAGIITGGVPPFRETRNYVMNGVNIYGLLGGNKLPVITAKSTDKNAETLDLSNELESIREDSLYVTDQNGRSPDQVKQSQTARSIYIE